MPKIFLRSFENVAPGHITSRTVPINPTSGWLVIGQITVHKHFYFKVVSDMPVFLILGCTVLYKTNTLLTSTQTS